MPHKPSPRSPEVLDFVKSQLGIHVRTHGLKTEAEVRAAMEENKETWVKMAISAGC
jgi:ABC-type uncharacterized transport system permease subunit